MSLNSCAHRQAIGMLLRGAGVLTPARGAALLTRTGWVAGWFCGAAGRGRAVRAALLSAFSRTIAKWGREGLEQSHTASSRILLHRQILSASSSLDSAPANFLAGPSRGHEAPAGTWAQGPLPGPPHLYQRTWHICPGFSGAPAGFSTQPQKPQRAPTTLSPAWSQVN